MPRPKKYVVIEWEDISGEPEGWLEVKKAESTEPVVVWSVGWLYKEDPTNYYIAMDWSEDEAVHQRGKIGKAVVRQVKEIKFPRAFGKKRAAVTPAPAWRRDALPRRCP